MIYSVSSVKGAKAVPYRPTPSPNGMWNVGKPPSIEARSPTRGTSMPVAITRMAMMPMPASGAGISLVMRGMTQMIAIVAATSANIRYNGPPDSHSPPDMP